MAKRKNSVALFEVITATKRKEAAASAAPLSLGTPKWWFKSKTKPAVQHASDAGYNASVLSPAYAPAQLTAPPETSAGPTSASAVVQRVVPDPSGSPPPERVTIPERAHEAGTFGLAFPANTGLGRRAMNWMGFGAKKLGFGSERREMTLRLRYTTAVIVGFALCVAVGLAYVSGRQANRASAGPSAMSSEQVRRGPILPGVLEVKPDRVVTSADTGTTDESDDAIAPVEPKRASPIAPAPISTAGGPKPLPRQGIGDVEIGLPRTTGLNYVIVQSYPEQKDADEAQKALQAAGIQCTVEPAPKGWAIDSDLKCVIGVHGFPRLSTPEYRQYVESIDAASRAFAGKAKLKRFEPSAYKWK